MIEQSSEIFRDHEVPDDSSVVTPTVAELKHNFLLQTTKSLKFRKAQLRSLIHGHNELRPALDEALKRDLGYDAFTAQFNSHILTEVEMRSSLDNLDKWAKSEEVELPIGTRWLM